MAGKEKEERRKDPRVDAQITAQFSGPGDFNDSFIGNVSRGGLLVKSERPLAVDSQFSLKFNIKGIDRTFEGLCRVMWIQELYDTEAGKLIPTMGCKFIDLPPNDLKTIESFIKEKLKN